MRLIAHRYAAILITNESTVMKKDTLEERTRARGLTRYLLKVIVFGALPAALFFSTVNLFPLRVGYPFEHVANPLTFVGLWIILGALYGLGRWFAYNRKYGRSRVTTD